MKQKRINQNWNRQATNEWETQTSEQALNETYNHSYFTNTVDGFDEESTLFTHMQIHDSYREGTIDNHIENSKNDMDSIPRKGYDMKGE